MSAPVPDRPIRWVDTKRVSFATIAWGAGGATGRLLRFAGKSNVEIETVTGQRLSGRMIGAGPSMRAASVTSSSPFRPSTVRCRACGRPCDPSLLTGHLPSEPYLCRAAAVMGSAA